VLFSRGENRQKMIGFHQKIASFSTKKPRFYSVFAPKKQFKVAKVSNNTKKHQANKALPSPLAGEGGAKRRMRGRPHMR
jgi:hypothetical protein